MKTIIKIITTALLVSWCSSGFAQTYEWQKPPKQGEKELELVLDTVYAGSYDYYSSSKWGTDLDLRENHSVEALYNHLYNKLKTRIGETHPDFVIRQFKYNSKEIETFSYTFHDGNYHKARTKYYYSSAIVVILDAPKPVENPLSKAIDKALIEIREGSRIAIDQIRVPTGINKEDYKDEVVEVLLDKGFKVVAKDYLEKLYEEQQAQQSGIYNDKTTVKENNLSAVGYYLNVRLTETALRVQVINVSTGEYEGNVTIKLQQ